MKNFYFFLLLIVCYPSEAQTNCSNAQSDLNYAYSHVKSAYDSNNLTHIKYYGKRSFDAFERAKKELENCDCQQAYDHAYKGNTLLSKLFKAETYEDGRFFVKRTREIAQKAIEELEICSKLSYEDEALAELEYERLKLEKQQLELKQKEAQIQQMLADKENRELLIKKEKLIYANDQAVSSNINAYNEMLIACECDERVTNITLNNENLLSKDLSEIKTYYLSTIKQATMDYLTSLNQCNSGLNK